MPDKSSANTSGTNIRLGSSSSISFRLLLALVGVGGSITIPIMLALVSGVIKLGSVEKDITTITQTIEKQVVVQEKEQSKLTKQMEQVSLDVQSLSKEVRDATKDRWTGRDDARFMVRYTQENELKNVVHYRDDR